MSVLFLDTSGWFAALHPREAGHRLARERFQVAGKSGTKPVTTSLVIAEMHSMFLRRIGGPEGMRFLSSVFDSGAYQIHYPTDDLIAASRARWLSRFSDQAFSLCDAVSFEVMRRERITSALATDRHFAIAGFEVLS